VKHQVLDKLSVETREIVQEAPERAPAGWAAVQDSLAAEQGLSLLLVEGVQPPALAISNNNSICETLQSSPEHVKLCDPYCGQAHERAIAAGTVTHYRCHAGLHCFAIPVQLDRERPLAVIGGRSFLTSADYRALAERFRAGDLQDALSGEVFGNVIFADEADLDHAALRLTESAREFAAKLPAESSAPESKRREQQSAAAPVEDLRAELTRVRSELDRRRRSADSVHGFTERIDATDPRQTYELILREAGDLLQAERGSLLLFDESSNELTIKAARGFPEPIGEVRPVPLGEGIAGSVLSGKLPLLAGDMESQGWTKAPLARRYKTKSFISYPILIGDRRIGVLNLADRSGGRAYDEIDLSIVESVAPQIALALERAEWQEKASQFQLMSITDPLTDLHNRRYLEARLSEEVSRSKRHNYPLTYMMIDIDNFKNYNDTNGHQAGDRALEMTAQCLKAVVRKVDVAARYGGEEFAILLPQTSLEEASVIADRIRRQVAATPYPGGPTQPLGAVTVSIGLSSFTQALNSAETIVRAADRALYHAKRQGKNRAYAYRDSRGGGAGVRSAANLD
jgi:diguanylate cyclase (GGDEF)-like protein